MWTWTKSEFWHKVKGGEKATSAQIKCMKEFGWDETDYTYQGAEAIIQNLIEITLD